MNQFLLLFQATLKTTFREKQVWFWSIFYPVLLMVVFLMIFGGNNDKETNFKAKVAVVTEQGGEFSASMLPALKAMPVLEWKSEDPVSREQGEKWVKEKNVDAVIVLPGEGGKEVELLVNKEKETSTTVQALKGIMGQVLQQANYSLAGITPELTLKQEAITTGSNKLSFVDFLMTGLIALSISQAGMFGMVAMVEMRRNGLLKRLMLTPMNMRLYGASNMSVRFVLSAIQVVLLSLIGMIFYGANIHLNLLSFLPIFIVGTMSFAAMGFFIAALSKSMESYMGIANLISFIMMFLSGVFFEYAMLPDYIKPIAKILPLTYFVDGVRDSMVYGFGLGHGAFWVSLSILAAWGLAFFAAASKLFKWKA